MSAQERDDERAADAGREGSGREGSGRDGVDPVDGERAGGEPSQRRPGEASRDEVDAAWADIVSRWDGLVPSADDAGALEAGALDGGALDGGAVPATTDAPAPPLVAAAGPRDHELAEPGDSFVPPVPPPLPRLRPSSWLPWAGVLGGPLLLALAALVYGTVPRTLLALAVTAFCAGAVLLVLRLPSRRDDDGDDGAVV